MLSPEELKPHESRGAVVVLKENQVLSEVKPVVPVPSQVQAPAGPVRTSLQASVQQATQAAPQKAPVGARPASMKSGNTNKTLDQSFFRCVLYSETSARKTTTAAHFAGPQFTRIILTRSEDQMIPLQGDGYVYEYCPDAASLAYAMKNPEALWPDWAALSDPERKKTIIVDDLTKAVQVLIESNSTGKDKRQAYSGALSDLDSLTIPLTRKPYNLILISLAKVRDNQISGEEMIGPDLSPSIFNYVTAEFAAVLYIQTKNFKMLTDRDRFTIMGTDPVTGKDKPFTREVFAKSKIPFSAVGKGLILKEEALDLRKFWEKIKAVNGGGKK